MPEPAPNAKRILPGGTVTLLFTDIEGSTRLLRELGDAYAELLSEHRRALRDAFQGHGGIEVDTQGDAFFYAFPSAREAVAAANEAQAALDAGRVKVRIGLHTGEPMLTDEGYVGMDVHRAARIMAAGHGGQTLISESTRDLVGDQTPLTDLGEHRLKDLSAPQRLWQLGDASFPPLKTLYHTNLPVQTTPMVGRERELAEADALLAEHRLLTLTGSGGTGKTRLALQLAARVVDDFPDGVWWVPLAAIGDERLVLPTIAQTIGASGPPAAFLRSKRMLLLLDNLEQVIESAGDLSELLAATTDLKLLITSREPLHIGGEVEYAVEPMAEAESIALFVERARQAEPREAVLEICRRLDCLPLAVELAAARTALLAPDELLARLDQRLNLLTGGRRDAPSRQRTLRATIEWSHELLASAEQRLFAHLGVFSGSFSLDAAEAIAGADLDALQSLIEKSLVRRWPSGRFGMLETIAEFARERLAEDPEANTIRCAHSEFFVALAEGAAPHLEGSDQRQWLDLLEEDHPNLRSALERSIAGGDAATALRLVAALRGLWMSHGHLTEGRRWAEAALAVPGDDDDALRARGLHTAALLSTIQGAFAAGMQRGEEALAMGRRLQLPVVVVTALMVIGRARQASDDVEGARAAYEEALALTDSAEVRFQRGIAIFNLAYLALSTGDLSQARTRMQDALDTFREMGNEYGIARALSGLGATALRQGDIEAAGGYIRESLARSHALGAREGVLWALELLAAASRETDPRQAAVLLGAAEALREDLATPLAGTELATREEAVAAVRAALDDATLDEAWAEGRRLDLDQIVRG
ncbi:MAG TPA: adenylate/guanylate cyclase domain-containing protein [Candidatus Limnocylindria bacterium]|nr:adenylate/guanylate cyclase domain-containing protein [Candidatus Limnocylindria bacterium]